MREHAVPAADIVTPNHFELDYLSGRSSTTMHQGWLPSMPFTRAGHASCWSHQCIPTRRRQTRSTSSLGRPRSFRAHPKLQPNGAGDAIAALFFAHTLRTGSVAGTLAATLGVRRCAPRSRPGRASSRS